MEIRKMMLMDDVIYKYFPEKHQITFLRIDENIDYAFYIISKTHDSDLNDLFAKTITTSQFQSRLSEKVLAEFKDLLIELERAGLVKSETQFVPLLLSGQSSGLKFNGDSFVFKIESLNLP